jgi:membrane protein
MPGGISVLLGSLEFVLLALAMTGLFHYVPNTYVRWRDAFAGGIFVAVGFEVAKRGFTWYLQSVPTYSVVYGAFATVPIFLIWIYLGWVIVLFGAVIAAYAPSLQMHVVRQRATPGHRFSLALAVLRELAGARSGAAHGLTLTQVAQHLSTDPLQIDPIVEALVSIDWVGRLDEEGVQRLVLLAEPPATRLAPLVTALLLEPREATQAFWRRASLGEMTLAEALGV